MSISLSEIFAMDIDLQKSVQFGKILCRKKYKTAGHRPPRRYREVRSYVVVCSDSGKTGNILAITQNKMKGMMKIPSAPNNPSLNVSQS